MAIRIESHTRECEEELNRKLMDWAWAVGEDAAATAADRAPVKTGRLKNSISHVTETDGAVKVYIGSSVKSEDGYCYAIAQELGTITGIVGKHFLKFGISAHVNEYKRMLEENLRS